MQVGSATDWVAIAAFNLHSCGIRSSGTLYCWGYGQLGDGTVTLKSSPTAVLSSSTWSRIETSTYGTCGIPGPAPTLAALAGAPPAPPTLVAPNCWGSNSNGQWADGTTSGASSYPGTSTTSVWQLLSMSDTSACGIMASTLSLYCWGIDAGYGNLGLNAWA